MACGGWGCLRWSAQKSSDHSVPEESPAIRDYLQQVSKAQLTSVLTSHIGLSCQHTDPSVSAALSRCSEYRIRRLAECLRCTFSI